MKKKVLFSLFSLTSLLASSQDYSKQYFYTGGPSFTNPNGKVKVAVLKDGKDKTIDLIKGNFSNCVSIYHDKENARYEGIAHIGRSSNSDLLVRYDMDTYERLDSVLSSGVQAVARNKEKLVVVKGYGATGAMVDILDANTLVLIKAVDEVPNPCSDVKIFGDSAFIAHSSPTNAGYPDSIGYVSILNLNQKTIVNTISLGQKAVDLKNLIIRWESDAKLHIYYSNSGDSLLKVVDNLVFHSIKASYTAAVTKDFTYGIQTTSPFLTALQTSRTTGAEEKDPTIKPVSGTYDSDVYNYDTTTNTYVILRTDFNTFGSIFLYSVPQAELVDSISIEFFGTALTIDYRSPMITTALSSNETFESQAKLFPNPCKEFLTVNNITNANTWEIRTFQGQQVNSGSITQNGNRINTEDLAKGVYCLMLKGNSEVRTIKFIKE